MKLVTIYLLLTISYLHTKLYAQQGKCMSGDCRDGFGHFLWESGDYYIGDWQAGRMSGYGVLYWKSGKKYIGNWRENEMNGEGTMYYTNGVTKSGIWHKNEFVQLRRKPFQLTPNNLQQARNQLFSMLHDRPTMLAWLSPKHTTVWQWIERKMAGEDTHSLILWQTAADENFIIPQGVKAVHRFPTATHEGAIWVDSTLHAEEMWSGFIFELFNIRNYIEFQKITHDVMHGRCDEGIHNAIRKAQASSLVTHNRILQYDMDKTLQNK